MSSLKEEFGSTKSKRDQSSVVQ